VKLSPRVTQFGLAAILWSLSFPVEAQQPAKLPRIGILTPSTNPERSYFEAFQQGLRELGYIEGKNIVIERRANEGKIDRNPTLAAELVRLNVDLIVAVGSGEIRAAKNATTTIPIVMVRGGDPVGSGFVTSLARPGGNITGLATLRPELSGKRLELLKEIVPKLSRVAFVASSSSADFELVVKEVELAAERLGIKIQYLDITKLDPQTAFREAGTERAEAVLFRVPGPFLNPRRTEIAALALRSRLPVIYEGEQEVEAGGLMSYGVNGKELYRRSATYVDKILKGAKPANLPVEQPTKFELVINLKTAKQIGLTIPPNVLARADRVIR
jgi:putative tryptophan/tyrosine transport system substrate-binding protein